MVDDDGGKNVLSMVGAFAGSQDKKKKGGLSIHLLNMSFSKHADLKRFLAQCLVCNNCAACKNVLKWHVILIIR